MLRGWVVIAAAAGAAAACWAAAGDQARGVFDSLYARRVAAAKQTRAPADDLALARELLDANSAARSHPALLELMCAAACDLAEGGRDFPLAISAMELLAGEVPARAVACAERILSLREQHYARASGREKLAVGKALVPAYVAAAGRRQQARDYEAALARVRKAYAIATALRLRSRADLQARMTFLAGRAKLAEEAGALKATVAAGGPAAAAARDRLVRCLVFELDDPNEATKYVSEADEVLRTYVPLAARGVDGVAAGACVELAQWYRHGSAELGKASRAVCLDRAAWYVQRYLGESDPNGLDHVKAELLRKQIRRELAEIGPVPGASLGALPTLNVKHSLGLLFRLDVQTAVTGVCFPPDGPLAAVAVEGGLAVCDLEKGKLTRAIKLPGAVGRMAISPDGRQVIAAHTAGRGKKTATTAEVWGLLDGRRIAAEKSHKGSLVGVGWWAEKPIAARLVPTGHRAFAIVLVRVDTGQKVGAVTMPTPFGVRARWSTDLTRMVVLTNDSAAVHAMRTGKVGPALRFEHRWADPFQVVVTPDGKAAAVGQRGFLPVFDVATSRRIATCASTEDASQDGARFRSVALSGDALRAAGATENGRILVFDARTGKRLTRLEGHETPPAVALSPDGKFLLSGGDTTVRLWGIP